MSKINWPRLRTKASNRWTQTFGLKCWRPRYHRSFRPDAICHIEHRDRALVLRARTAGSLWNHGDIRMEEFIRPLPSLFDNIQQVSQPVEELIRETLPYRNRDASKSTSRAFAKLLDDSLYTGEGPTLEGELPMRNVLEERRLLETSPRGIRICINVFAPNTVDPKGLHSSVHGFNRNALLAICH